MVSLFVRSPSLATATGLATLLALVGCFHDTVPALSGTAGGSGSSATTGATTPVLTSDATSTTATSTTSSTTGVLESTSDSSMSAPATTSTTATTTLPPPADMGTPTPACPVAPELVACYAFEDGWDTATLRDGSGHDLDGVLGGATPIEREGGLAAATGVSSTIYVPGSPLLASSLMWTVAAWVRLDAFPVGERAGVLDHDGDYGVFISSDGHVFCNSIDQDVISITALSLETWIHVACVRSDSALRLYVNGALESQGLPKPSTPGVTLDLVLANASPPTPDEALVGALDDVTVWIAALKPEQICAVAGLDC